MWHTFGAHIDAHCLKWRREYPPCLCSFLLPHVHVLVCFFLPLLFVYHQQNVA